MTIIFEPINFSLSELNINFFCIFPLVILTHIFLRAVQRDDIVFDFEFIQKFTWKQLSKWVFKGTPKWGGFLKELFGDGVFRSFAVADLYFEGDVVEDALVNIVWGVAGEDGETELAECFLGDVRKRFFELL